MATSGTVATVPFNNLKVIEHACRRAGYRVENVGAQDLAFARDNLFTMTAEWINKGFPLWTRQYDILSAAIGNPDVATPQGTVDVFQVFWRILMPYRGSATTTGGDDASTLFSGEPGDDVTIAGPSPGVYVAFGGETEVDTIGVLPGAGANYTAALEVQSSEDGVTWTTVQTLASQTFVAGKWAYQDLKPTISPAYIRIVRPGSGSWVLNQMQIGLPNWQDIPIGGAGGLSMDDYYNQSNRDFRNNQPNSSFIDRLLDPPTIKIWPLLNVSGFYSGCVTALTRRYIQDPGALTDSMEVPQRWLEAVQWGLAELIMAEFPLSDEEKANALLMQARTQRQQFVAQKAMMSAAAAWAEERNRSPIRIIPNISAYTR